MGNGNDIYLPIFCVFSTSVVTILIIRFLQIGRVWGGGGEEFSWRIFSLVALCIYIYVCMPPTCLHVLIGRCLLRTMQTARLKHDHWVALVKPPMSTSDVYMVLDDIIYVCKGYSMFKKSAFYNDGSVQMTASSAESGLFVQIYLLEFTQVCNAHLTQGYTVPRISNSWYASWRSCQAIG